MTLVSEEIKMKMVMMEVDDDEIYLVMKVITITKVIYCHCDVLPVAIFFVKILDREFIGTSIIMVGFHGCCYNTAVPLSL